MGGGNQQTTNQSQNSTSTSSPYAPAQPLLQSIIDRISGLSGTPTAAQTAAGNNLVAAANGIPNIGPTVQSTADSFMGGDPTGMLNSGYEGLSKTLTPIINSNADPMSNPGMRGWLDTIQNDVSNNVNGQFAAAGRDFSPANSMALGRGIAQGEAPVLANQYNTNMDRIIGAATGLYNAGNTTAGARTGNMLSGTGLLSSVPGLFMQPAQMQMEAANTQAGLPMNVLQQLEQLGIPLSALGGTTTSSGTGTSTTEQKTDPTSNIIAGLLGAASLGSKFMMSDERTKDDIAHVGWLNDGQPVFSYHYKDDPNETPQIGLLAQEVEKSHPEAVREFGGVKMVNYDAATRDARHIGGWLDRMAA